MPKPYAKKTAPSPIECCEHAHMEAAALRRRIEAGDVPQREALLRSVAETSVLISQALDALRADNERAA